MATVTIYNKDTGLSYYISIDILDNVINGVSEGCNAYYIRFSTNATDPEGHAIRDRILDDATITLPISIEVRNQIADILAEIEGAYVSSSSSSTSSKSSSTQSKTSSSGGSSLSTLSSTSSRTPSSQSTSTRTNTSVTLTSQSSLSLTSQSSKSSSSSSSSRGSSRSSMSPA